MILGTIFVEHSYFLGMSDLLSEKNRSLIRPSRVSLKKGINCRRPKFGTQILIY